MGLARWQGAVACALWLALCLPEPAVARVHQPDLVLITFGDTHSAWEQYPRLVATIDRVLAATPGVPARILVSGDLFEGTDPLARRSGGAGDWALLEALVARAPVLWNLGNHDVDLAPPDEVVARARALGVAVLSNLRRRISGDLLAPSALGITVPGGVVAVLGVAPYEPAVWPRGALDDWMVPEPVAWHAAVGPRLRAGADWVVLLSHAGLQADRRMLPSLPEGSLLVGGHDHRHVRAGLRASVYAQHGYGGTALGITRVRFVPGGARFDHQELRVGRDTPPDPGLAATIDELVARWRQPQDDEVLGHAAGGLSAQWVAEVLRSATGADLAMVNHTAFGPPLPPGPVRRWPWRRFVRFDNALRVARVDGVRLRRLLDHARRAREGSLAQQSGDVLVIAGGDVDPTRTYTLVTTDWVAGHARVYLGGDLAFRPWAGPRLDTLLQRSLAR